MGVQIQCWLDNNINLNINLKHYLNLGSAFLYIIFLNFNGFFFAILRLYFIFKTSSISGINLSTLQLTLNISSAEVI